MYVLDETEDFANRHIKSIVGKESATPSCVEMLGELIDILKDISEIRKNESTTYAMDNYSPEKTVEYTRRYADRMPSANTRTMNMNYGMYGDTDHMIQKMENMMAEAQTEQERKTIHEIIDKLRKG